MSFSKILIATTMLLLPAAAHAANVNCGDVIDGVDVVLDGNVGPCAGTAVTVTNGGSLDLDSHFIVCDGSPFSIGVVVSNGSELRNGLITGCDFSGVQVTGTTGSKVEHVGSWMNGEGFSLYASGKSTIRYNVAYQNSNSGFLAAGPHRLTGNQSYANGGDGFLANVDGASFSGNLSSDNGGHGYNMNGGVKMKNDVALSNSGDGFLFSGFAASAKSIVASNSTAGIRVTGNDNKISKCRANITGTGIRLEGNANSVSGCSIHQAGTGISAFFAAADNQIKKNIVSYAGGHALETGVAGCGTNTWTGNVGDGNDPCID